jgi:putative spermidine/putrescine transport system ATP-binding protein
VYEHPSTRFISTFVGKANLLDCRVSNSGATRTCVEVGALSLDVDDTGYGVDTAALLSVRPEKLQLVPVGQGRIDGEVRERFFLGSQWLYRVTTAVGELTVLSPNDGREALEEGGRTGIDWPAHCMRLLPADAPEKALAA